MVPNATGDVPIIQTDDLALPEQDLMRTARDARFTSSRTFYPGVQAPAPPTYAQGLAASLAPLLAEAVGHPLDAAIEVLSSEFSIVTQPSRSLRPLQRVPHVDTTDHRVFAVLHYLCDHRHGATSFFRHRSSGLARITAGDRAAYDDALDRDVGRQGPPPPGYLDPDAAWQRSIFEMLYDCRCRVGRVIAYPANLLHCGRIPAGHELAPEPDCGRLTVNTFLRLSSSLAR